MRPSHHLCLLVPSIPHSSATIIDRPSHDSSFVSLSRKRSRSSAASVPLSSPILGALSSARADLLPSPKRIRSSRFATDLEVSSVESSEPSRSRGTDLGMDDDVEKSDGIDIDPKIQAEIDECVAYARVVVEVVDQEEIETGARGPIELERDNMRLRDMMDVASQRVTRSQRRELRVQREMRQIYHFRFYDRMRIARLEACGGEQEEVNGNGGNGNGRNGNEGNGNGGNGNGGANGNGNGNRGGNGYNPEGFVHVARECTYQDFLKCQPLSLNGTEGVVGLTRWFEKMETVFYISNCPEKYQVKYATCTLLNSALTWWNSHKRTIGIESAYAMSWTKLMKLMTEVMVPNKEDKVKRFVGGLLDNIQGNVIAAEPTKLQDAIRIANNLMDQKMKGC
ncbi:hypothetical protein Tco_1233759 [Tanacetum coccineum]